MFPCKETETLKALFLRAADLLHTDEVLNKTTCEVTVNTPSTIDYANCLLAMREARFTASCETRSLRQGTD